MRSASSRPTRDSSRYFRRQLTSQWIQDRFVRRGVLLQPSGGSPLAHPDAVSNEGGGQRSVAQLIPDRAPEALGPGRGVGDAFEQALCVSREREAKFRARVGKRGGKRRFG